MNLITRFIDICFLKAGPQDIPASAWLMKLSLIIYFGIATASQLIEYPLSISLASAAAELVLLLIWIKVALMLRGFSARFNQTVTAMAATSSLISIVALPLVMMALDITPEAMSAVDSGIMMVIMFVLLWSLMVTAHIFRNALEIKASMAVALTVLYTISMMVVVGTAMSGATP